MNESDRQVKDNGSKRALMLGVAGSACIVAAWQVLSFFMPRIVLATPVETAAALFSMAGSTQFWIQIAASIWRIVLGVAIGGTAGFFLGLAAGLNSTVRHLLEPLRWIVMSVPAVVVVVIAMLWFGMGSGMVVFITSILLSPLVYVNTVRGLDMVDSRLTEMAAVYCMTSGQKIRHIYIPAVMSHVASAMVVATGMGVRIVILAEVMGASEGIGHALSLARSTIDTARLFAWVFICIAIVAVIEYLMIKPVERRIMRWKH